MPTSLRGLVERAANAYLARSWGTASAGFRLNAAATVTRGFERAIYERLHENGFAPDAIIDIGANRADWSRMIRPIFPDVPIVMVEAQSALEPELANAAKEIGRAEYRIALLGPVAGEERTFYEMGTGSSLLPENSNVSRTSNRITATTLDLMAENALPAARSIFLKLDIQGAELMVLAGGAETLARCGAVQLEVALLSYNTGAPLLAEVVAFMAERGLLVTEVAGFSRPGAHLVQIDLIFAPGGSALRPGYFSF